VTSFKQIAANRANARRSTGPTTEEGKQRSRCNAVRHGLTAETVIGTLEDAADYAAFEAAVTADYDAQSAVERELILRLASLLWRLRRATSIETGLFETQAEHSNECRTVDALQAHSGQIAYAVFKRSDSASPEHDQAPNGVTNNTCALARSNPTQFGPAVNPTAELARCYLQLTNLPSFPLDRLSRYEATLWRQVDQILLALDTLDRRKPQERRRGCVFGGPRESPS
jgi:hypothetical protein